MRFRSLAAPAVALTFCLVGGAAHAQDNPQDDGFSIGTGSAGFGGQQGLTQGGEGGEFPAIQNTNPSVDSPPPTPKFNQSCKGPDCKPRRFTIDFSRIVNRRILPPDNE
ncbi:hypothetical protein [Streptomyces sp. NPDC059533]|uniref:hypothetical protein n=1 Tax=unclassified Streptomyces TaxID=2593676 RepID=UPI0036B166DD